MYINLDKYEFSIDSVEYLGFIVGLEGVKMIEERVKAIANWSTLTSVKDIQVFLGFIGFYRRFIRNYTKIASLLTDLLRGQSTYTFVITEVVIRAFKTLRKAFTTALILKHYDPCLPI